jgi:hypothetical protein
MKQMANLPRRARWAVPAGIVAVAGGLLAGSMVGAAAAAPPLPPRTAAQLLATVPGKPPPLAGTVVATASLGLPALPPLAGTVSLPSLLAGSHTINLWYADPSHYRLALPQSMSESDVIRNGSSLWLWGSSANLVTHLALPAGAKTSPLQSLPLTPQQAAGRALTEAGRTTAIRVDSNVTVAGEAAYQLVLAPESPRFPDRPGAHRHRRAPPRAVAGAGVRAGRGQPGRPDRVHLDIVRHAGGGELGIPAAGRGDGRARQHRAPPGKAAAKAQGNGAVAGSGVIGKDWLAVADLPESALSSLAGGGPSGKPASSAPGLFGHSSATAGPAPGSPGGPGLGIGTDVIFSGVLQAARHVSGSWGSGRLLQTPLISVLVTSNGRILFGAVTPEVLYRAATQAAHAPPAFWHHSAAARSK